MSRLVWFAVVVALLTGACTGSASPRSVDGAVSTEAPTTEAPTMQTVPRSPTTTQSAPTSTATASSTVAGGSTTILGGSGTGITVVGDSVDGPGTFRRSMLIGGELREYVLHVPQAVWERVDEAALVIDLHGLGSTAETQDEISGFGAKAREAGFIVAQPQAAGVIPTWQAGVSPSPDVEFLRAVVLDVSHQVKIGAVFAVGFSNGGGMAHRLACDAPETLAAFATVAGAYPDTGPCAESLPLIAFHGTADPVVPFRGAGVLLPDVATWAASWAELAGCVGQATTQFAEGVDLTRWEGCGDGQAVELYVVEGGRHGWPGTASATRLFESTSAVSATDLIWDFFSSRI